MTTHACTGANCAHSAHSAQGAPSRFSYTKGLHEVGDGVWAYLQPDGGWGWSNAGLLGGPDDALLVDTLFDERLTDEMLGAMADAAKTPRDAIRTVVNTHANGDHTFGNHLLEGAEIIASATSAEEMDEAPPELLAAMVSGADGLGEAGAFFKQKFGVFAFDEVTLTKPTRTFDKELTVSSAGRDVVLYEVGPAHTRGDVIAHVPSARTVFTGDILFIDGAPIIWAGPVSNWLKAIDLICGLDVDTIVPGHGPITDKAGARRVGAYLTYINQEAKARFDAGLSAEEAAFDISLGDFASWGDNERIAINVDTLYKEYRGETSPPDFVGLFGVMARLEKKLKPASSA